MKRYVQHVSGQGRKFELKDVAHNRDHSLDWLVSRPSELSDPDWVYIPRSEYRLCPAPEVWKDVTEDTKITSVAMYNSAGKQEEWHGLFHECSNVMWPGNGYRLRKIDGQNRLGETRFGFVIEKKVSE